MVKRFVFKLGLKMLLGISCSSSKEIKYFSFIREEMVIINAEFSLYLDSPIFKSGVYPIK